MHKTRSDQLVLISQVQRYESILIGVSITFCERQKGLGFWEMFHLQVLLNAVVFRVLGLALRQVCTSLGADER
jgi:hypothetical protein